MRARFRDTRSAFLVAALLPSLLVLAGPVAHAERLPIKTYTTADGLLRDVASCIAQDSRGFLWFCTADGLSRFDGYGFTNYTTDDGLPHRVVNDFLETRDGIYWAATNEGLARLNPHSERRLPDPIRVAATPLFVAFKIPDSESQVIEVLFEDPQGKLWCGTDDGLFWFEEQNGHGRFHRVDLPKVKPNSSSIVLAITADSRGNLWIGTDGQGLYRLWPDGRIEHFTDKNGLPLMNVTSVLAGRDGDVWIGLAGNGGACHLTAAPSADRRIVSRCYTRRDGLSENWVRHLYQTSDGDVWISTTGGVTTFNRSTDGSASPFRVYKDAQGLCDSASAVLEDRERNIWVSTACGIKKIVRNGFVRFTEADGLASSLVNGFFNSHAGELFVIAKVIVDTNEKTSRAVHTINRFDNNRFTFATPELPAEVSTGWGGGQIVVEDKRAAWWLPGDKRAAYRFPKADHFSQLGRRTPQPIPIPDGEVFRIYEDTKGDVWMATMYEGHLLHWELATETWRDHKDAIPGKATATCFADDRDGNVWIGFDYGEPKLARYRDGRFRVFSTDEIRSSGGITALLVDHLGRLWFASRTYGVGRIDNLAANQVQIVWYTRRAGLATDGTLWLVEDNLGRIYVGHGRGVDRIEPDAGRIRHYTTADGLPQGPIQFAARDRQGALWFASYGGGLARLIPEQDLPRQPPNILLTGLRIAGVRQAVSNLGETTFRALTLSPSQNNVSVEFVGLGASLGEELKYSYRLEGAESGWSEPSAQRLVDFANLAPGRYRLVVRAVTADGTASANPATFTFTILRPFWQRWWFVTPAIMLIGVAVYAAYRYRLSRVLELERVRTRIAADLHDDIGASLSRMAIMSEVVKRQVADRTQQSVPMLSDIADSARQLVDSMRDIVWAIDPRRDDLSSVVSRIRQFASDVLEGQGIKWDFQTPADLDIRLGPDQRRHIFLFFKEAITNVARHSNARAVWVTIHATPHQLIGTVRDDGRGFVPLTPAEAAAQGHRGHGLENMERRVRQVGGTLTVQTSPDQGTHLQLTIPLTKP